MAETRLREALELLDGGRRWYQGDFAGPGGVMCMLGALNCARTGNASQPWEEEADDPDEIALCRVVQEHFPDRLSGIPYAASFNDDKDTTFADVEAVMEKAAIMREGAVE